MSKEAMRAAVEALQHAAECVDPYELVWQEIDAALSLLRAELEAGGEAGKEVELNIIRFWPDGMAARLEHVWKDVIGFIPNYKLYDLQRVLAEFGFTMKVYEGAASPVAADTQGDAKDAARYRWLRDCSAPTMDPADNGKPWCARCDNEAPGNQLLYGETLDAAVDAAIEGREIDHG